MDGEARKTGRKRANVIVWSVWIYFGSAHLVSVHRSYVGHNSTRQAGFPLQQARVLKTGDKRGSERLTERQRGRDGKGGGYQNIMRCVDGRVVGQGMREERMKYKKK